MIKYRLIERKDMRKGAEEDAKLYYPQLVGNGRVEFETLIEEIAEQASLTTGDVKNCVDRLIYNTAHHLKEGRSVDMGDIGSFWTALRSGGSPTKKDYDSAVMMRTAKVVFRPGKALREALEQMQFQRVSEDEPEQQPSADDDDNEQDGPTVQ